jgi:glycine C-acetyltransferase
VLTVGRTGNQEPVRGLTGPCITADSPIVSVMLYSAKLAQDVARDLFYEGIYVVGFFFPVVAKGQARIRTQLSAAHDKHYLDTAIAVFKNVGAKHGILGLKKQQIIDTFGM